MSFQVFRIEHAPAALPIWEVILDDLGRPPVRRISKVLGVGQSTVYRWNQHGQAPRAACLALFWLTRWGRSLIDAQATNDAVLYAGYARSLQADLDAVRLRLAQVETQLIGGSHVQQP